MIEWMKEILGDAYTEDIDNKITARLTADYVPKADLEAANTAKSEAEAALAAANDKYKEMCIRDRNGRARRRMKVTKYCEHCPWRSADPYCLWPRCFKKYLTGPQQERKKQADERIAAGADGQPRN